ncbi:hypothetical protein B5X24_HaOG213984 [Helicoverpa armigera]|nr:hypothetical protein B5X24_HaOG213984 [Helicoverpa armigera]
MRIHIEADFYDIPPNAHHGRFGGVGRSPFGCPSSGDFHEHSRRPGFGPFGRFNHSPERYDRHCHERDHCRRCFEDSRRHRCDCRCNSHCNGPFENCCCGSSSPNCRGPVCHSPEPERHCPFIGRRQEHHFGGPFEAWRGPWNWPWGGYDRHECNHRRPCVFHCCNEQPRHSCCGKCCKSEPCNEDNKDDENSDAKDEKNENNKVEVWTERENKIRFLIFTLVKAIIWRTVKNNTFM